MNSDTTSLVVSLFSLLIASISLAVSLIVWRNKR